MDLVGRPAMVSELACEQESIHIPGFVQPHGVLLALDRVSRVIVGVGA